MASQGLLLLDEMSGHLPDLDVDFLHSCSIIYFDEKIKHFLAPPLYAV